MRSFVLCGAVPQQRAQLTPHMLDYLVLDYLDISNLVQARPEEELQGRGMSFYDHFVSDHVLSLCLLCFVAVLFVNAVWNEPQVYR